METVSLGTFSSGTFPLFIFLILSLTAVVAAVRIVGAKRNRMRAAEISKVLEKGFQPVHKVYTNIGGVVGYHFSYQLQPPVRSLEGTFTLFPRHALLYYPVARLLGREDELHFSLEMDVPVSGEARLIQARHYRSGGSDRVDDEMAREEVEVGGEPFILFYYNRGQAERLLKLLRLLPDAAVVRECAMYGAESLVYFQVNPQADALEGTFQTIATMLPEVLQAPYRSVPDGPGMLSGKEE